MTTASKQVKRIRFIVTGDLERKAIVASLSAQFPKVASDSTPVEWLRPQKTPAATTHRLIASQPPSGVLAEVAEGEDGTPADLVIAVDDLELNNFDQPAIVCRHFSLALEGEIERRALSQAAEERLRNRIRARCSFHLLCPMVEAYFFGEYESLTRAGCAPDVHPLLRDENVEAFNCQDPTWLPTCALANERKHRDANQPMPWWREERHAKRYLEHLVAQNGGFYEEVHGGSAAFRTLDWPRVPSGPEAVAFIRAMFEDIADFLGVTSPLGPLPAPSLTYPDRRVDRTQLLLRNG